MSSIGLGTLVRSAAAQVLRKGCPHGLALTLERDGDSVAAVLEDDATPFDPTSFSAPESGREVVAGLAIGGWGIPIVRSLTSAVSYERRGDRNRTRIEMRIPAEG
jgi:anti-sigma regulatory factor (Ser/Thr protein kinase)